MSPTRLSLVLDTVGPWCAAALQVGDQVFEAAEDIGRGHAELLAPMVEGLLDQAGVAAGDLERIGVNTGPGSFAGARVGVAFARGLALSTQAQAIGVGLLPALALKVCPDRSRTVFAIHDAKRDEYLWSRFAPGQDASPVERGPLDQASAVLARTPNAVITGSGSLAVGGTEFDPRPPLAALSALTAAAANDAPPPAPIYARPPDAKPARA